MELWSRGITTLASYSVPVSIQSSEQKLEWKYKLGYQYEANVHSYVVLSSNLLSRYLYHLPCWSLVGDKLGLICVYSYWSIL